MRVGFGSSQICTRIQHPDPYLGAHEGEDRRVRVLVGSAETKQIKLFRLKNKIVEEKTGIKNHEINYVQYHN